MNTTTGEPPRDLLQEVAAIAPRYNLDQVYVFGSRAEEIAGRMRGRSVPVPCPASDVDIGVKPAAGWRLSPRERVEIAVALEDLLEVPRVDLVPLSEADPFLAVNVIRGELLYCADRDAQAEYELYLLRRAGDLAGYARARLDHILTGAGRCPPLLQAKVITDCTSQLGDVEAVVEALVAWLKAHPERMDRSL